MSYENAEKLFLQEKPTLALLLIGSMGKTYASVISKEIDSTFAHTTRILAKMEQCGLIRFTFEGRIKFVELTEHGRDVETALKEFRDIISTGFWQAELEKGNEDVEENVEKAEDLEIESEEIKKLDPLNAEVLERIRNLKSKIENIHKDSVEKGDSKDMISRKLGPYKRNIKKLQNEIENANPPIDETVISALEESERILETFLKN